ncbi:MAG: DNA polymerase Y family protein, partial [Nocardioidaceae bacterium]
AGGSGSFLAPLSVDVLDRPDLVSLLRRLGLRTLGDFAQLPGRDVLARFGQEGAFAHRLAGGRDGRPVAPRRPPPELERHLDLEPPLEQVEPIAFSIRRTAEEFVDNLAGQQLVCTSLWIEVHTDAGEVSERQWLHPRWFDTADVIDRVRWQLGAAGSGPGGGELSAPVCQVRLVPETVAPLADHAEGLWGGGPDERIHRTMSRVQSMLGHGAVVSAVVGGGRGPRERQTLVPWGDQPAPARPGDRPWPGSLPPPAPATVYPDPRPALVVGAGGRPVGVTARGALTDVPTRFCASGTGELSPVQAWTGPWPVDERWWDEGAARRVARFQVVGIDGSAWLLSVEDGRWWTEARYD